MKFIIKTELPDLNKYINAERTNKFIAANMKKKATESVAWEIKQQKCNKKYVSVFLEIVYYCKNRRKDPDNVSYTKKFILDGMQKAGIIPNDGWNNIKGWDETFVIDKENPRIEVTVLDSSKEKKE